ncbi:hypothetical protein [Salinicola sp. NYA28a]
MAPASLIPAADADYPSGSDFAIVNRLQTSTIDTFERADAGCHHPSRAGAERLKTLISRVIDNEEGF